MVTDAKLKFTKDGKFRQFGFIGYKTEEEAQKAVQYFNNTFIDASRLVVSIVGMTMMVVKGLDGQKL